MRLRVGVVGLGSQWENRHRPALRALSDRFEVRAVCSTVSLLAEQAAKDFQCAAVDGFQALAARPDVDALMLLDTDWHGPLPILAACQWGKAVYCASALELQASQALAIKQRVDRSGVAFMAELPFRQAPATLRLKELIATRLGPPRLLFCHHRGRPGSANRSLRSLLEQCDWCRYVVGQDPVTIQSSQHGPEGAADYCLVTLDFAADGQPGPLAHVSYGDYLSPSWPEAASYRRPAGLQVCCEKGVAFVDLPSNLIWFDAAGRHHESLEHDRPVGEQLLNLFHRSVTSLVLRTSGLDDACFALAMIEAAACSRQEGRRIAVDEIR